MKETSQVIRRGGLTLIFVVVCLVLAPAAAGQPNLQENSPLALQVHYFGKDPPAYQTVGAANSKSNGAWYARFRRVHGWKQPPDSLPVTAVDIRAVLAGNVAQVRVSVFLGELHQQQRPIAEHSVREGEKLVVRELAQFGVEPFELALVTLAPGAADLPQIISKAPSIDFVMIEPVFSTMPSCRIAIRNLSSKNVSALSVLVLQGGQRRRASMPQGKDGAPLIAAGAVYEFNQGLATRTSTAPNGYVSRTLRDQVLEISTAVFEDGSFEGDVEPALMLRGFAKGRKLQLRRIVGVFQEALQQDRSQPESAIERLANDVGALSIEADPVAVQELVGEFPNSGGKTPKQLKTIIEVALAGVRQDTLNEIQRFRLRNPKLDTGVFQAWLAASKQRYEAWLSRL